MYKRQVYGRSIEGGAGVLLDMPLNPSKELSHLTLETLSNDVVIGLMGVTSVSYTHLYLAKWNWMNIFAHADYTYNNLLNVSANMSVDGSSANGKYTNRFRCV